MDDTLRLEITRIFDAPRDLVFRAWTDPAQLTRWFGPHGMTTPLDSIRVDLRPGGEWRACMVRDSDGFEAHTGGLYREVAEPERLVFTWGIEVQGTIEESLVTIVFDDVGGKTKMSFTQVGFPTTASRDEHEGGWTETFERLASLTSERG
ncbi:SRPBCC domain-containing protein [Amycolatopsis sp. NPDC059657]|uniref:SRPBCC family protein n=1 Tax=Amycolatopsis sp. NPDC059657 TaxID=3346899 RepID=UPI00366E626A